MRTGAAQALGLTGHAKVGAWVYPAIIIIVVLVSLHQLIHDEVGRRLTDASEMIRLDALKKVWL